MSHFDAASPEEVAELWRRRFGQPPPIVAEAELMLRILEAAAPQIEPPPRSWVEPE